MAFNKAGWISKTAGDLQFAPKMSNAALAAGDNMGWCSRIRGHYLAGQRKQITQAVDKMEQAYDTKYPELMKICNAPAMDMAFVKLIGTPDCRPCGFHLF